MTSRWTTEKQAVVDAALEIAELKLVTGSSGNLSLRLGPDDGSDGLLAVTPQGGRCASIAVEDIVVADFDAEPVEDDLVPSSETLLHVAIYRTRPDVRAVIHTHSVFATVASVAGLEIPPIIDEMVIAIGGPVEIAAYAFPGTQELADSVCAALGDRNAALIRNHGSVGVGRDLREAVDVSALLEHAAKVLVYATLAGKVNTLPPEAIEVEKSMYQMRGGRMEGPA